MNERIPTKAEQYQGLAFVVVSFLAVGAVFSVLSRISEQQQMRSRESGRGREL